MTVQSSKLEVKLVDRDFVMTRIIDAPRAHVFKAWTDPKQLAKWWGPREYLARCEGDVRVGGQMRLVMISPEGKEYGMTVIFKEIDEPRRLVWLQNCKDHPPDWHDAVNKHRPNAPGNIGDMLLTITFEELEGKTKMTITMYFEDASDRDALVNLGMTEGWSQSFEKLDELFI
jgi:uncharacterized protein YndB with AHSA1/START domain